MSRNTRYEPPPGYDPETASPEMRAIVESLERECEVFHEDGANATLSERVSEVAKSLSERGYKVDRKAIRDYFKNIGEASYEGGKTGLFIIGPKSAVIGAKLGALAGVFGVKAERIKQGRGKVVEAAEGGFERVEKFVRRRVFKSKGDKPEEMEP